MSSSLRSIRTSTHSCVDIWPPGPSSALSGRSGRNPCATHSSKAASTDDDSGGVRFEDEYRYLIAT